MGSNLPIRIILCCVIIVQLFSFEIEAGCVCNAKGINSCGDSCNELRVVRPKMRYNHGESDAELPPIGDSCWCSKQLIEPAAVSKTCNKHQKYRCGCKNKGEYGDSVYSSPTYPVPQTHHYKDHEDSLPADPISVSLAMKAGKALKVPEAKLSYGFAQKPVDGLKQIYFSSVPEENLFKLKHDVITLKKRLDRGPKDDEEYVAIEEEDTESGSLEDDEQPHLTYKQLGYEPERFKNPKFREVSSHYIRHRKYYKDGGKGSGDCGHRHGRVPSSYSSSGGYY